MELRADGDAFGGAGRRERDGEAGKFVAGGNTLGSVFVLAFLVRAFLVLVLDFRIEVQTYGR